MEAVLIWKIQIPAKVKFFSWIVALQRCLTADWLTLKGILANPICQLCRTLPETATHLFATCSFTSRFKVRLLRQVNVQVLSMPHLFDKSLFEWCFDEARRCSSAVLKERLGAVVMLGWWHLWSERNQRVFHSKHLSVAKLCDLAFDELMSLKHAGCKAVISF